MNANEADPLPALREVDFDPFAAPELSGTAPSTEAQREIWAAVQMGDDASLAFNESVALTLEGPLDVVAWQAAIQDLAQRHEALRMTFSSDGLTLCIAARLEIAVPIVDISGLDARERDARVRAAQTREVEAPFSLEHGPLFRTQLLRLSETTHFATFSAHHIVCDGWSMAVILHDLGLLYSARKRGQPAELPAATPFGAYAREERAFEASPEYLAAERYFLDKLRGTLPVLDLPLDGTRPPQKTYASIREDFTLEPSLVERVKKAGAKNGASFFTTMLAAFYALLGRLSGEDDIIVGIPAAGQSVTGQPELVGHCVNTLPLRVGIDRAMTMAAFLRLVRTTMLDAYDHQRCTFGGLLKRLAVARDPSRLPLVSVLFNVDQAVSGEALEFEGLSASYRSSPRSYENFEIFINAAETKGKVVLECQFNSDLFAVDTIRRWLDAYRALLSGLAEDDQRALGEISILPEADRARIVYEWNATFAEFPRTSPVHRLFEEQAARTPDATAIVCGERSITFGELDRRGNRLARHLRALGVKKEVLVGLAMQRSVDMMVGLVGILKAGGAYVPLDPAFPRDRIAFMLEDSQMPVLVTETGLASELPAHRATVVCLDAESALSGPGDDTALGHTDADAAGPENLAYVIYTSGSTGKPKGVCVPHRAVVNFIESMAKEPGLSADDVLLAVTTLSFDIAVLELHLPLSVGAKVVLATREMATDGALLKSAIERHGVSAMQATPSTFRLLLAAGWNGDERFKVLCGGEAFPRDLAGELARRAGSVWNMYGPTETTVWSTCARIGNPPGRVLIGKPIANTTTYVLDERLQPVPVGVPGELHIGGDGVTRGYLNRPELTQERFVPDVFSGDPAARLYKTGDLVRYRADGNLEYLRRNDNQIKLRGYRIELGEIESMLAGAPGVKQAVVVLRELRPGDVRLVGYVVMAAGGTADDAELRQHLRQSLPEYMVPSHIVTLSAFPLTPNGKIDKKALPAPEADVGRGREHVAPRTPTEAAIVAIFEDVLGVARVSVDDGFFELGGHSLLAAQALSRMQREHGIVLPLRKLFEEPTPAGLARAADTARSGPGKAAPAKIPRREGSGPAPASLMQQRLWLLEQFDPGLALQNLPSAFRMRGALDLVAFERAVNEIVQRHEPPRTRFLSVDGEPMQVVEESLTIPLALPRDLSTLPAVQRESELIELLRAEASRPFDLVNDPLVRGSLYRLSPDEHVFFWMAHHAVWDGWSFDVFLNELDQLYRAFVAGKPSPLPALPIRYQDFAEWQRSSLDGEELNRQASYWKQQLAGPLPVLELPTDRPRPPRLSHRGGTEPFTLSAAEVDALTALGRKADATLYMVILAAFELLLQRYSGQDDILVGTPIRGRTQPETEDLLGFFVNTLVFRTDLSNDPTFLELLSRVRKVAVEAYGHQEMPFEVLVQQIGVERDMSRTPVFQAFFTYQNVRNRASCFGDIEYTQIHVHAPVAPTDLYLWVKETSSGIAGGIDYAADLFERETIVRFLKQFRQLLAAVLSDATQPISALEILPEAERRAILAVNTTQAPYDKQLGVHQLVERRAAAEPERVAVLQGSETLSYRELDRRASALAVRLRELGVARGTLVGLLVQRSPSMLVGMLGILKAGAAYVPLDPAFPDERLEFMVEDAQLSVLVCEKALEDKLPSYRGQRLLLDDPSSYPELPPGLVLEPAFGDDPAYVIYTSGSTGKPKGVVVPHVAVVNFLFSIEKSPGVSQQDTLLAVTTLSFDIAVLELWLPLAVGAKVVLASRDEAADGDRLLALLRQSRATVLQATPATWWLLLGAGFSAGDLQRALVGGEAVPLDLAKELTARVGSVWNMYGPTETTVWSTSFELRAPVERVLIGRPLDNTRVYVVDRAGQLCPLGAPGELLIGGDGVTRGYFERPELTAERFLADRFVPGGRVYRTGDLVRLLADGNLQYLRRNDNQVKLRGYRIELGEIETTLQQHLAVAHAVTIVREDRAGDARLVAYLVKNKGEDATDSELRAHLRAFLPEYMIPQHFVELEQLPLTPNGKVDRKALPAPHAVASEQDDAFREPKTENEKLVAEVWKNALAIEQVSADDNFFSIGGHSLLSIKVISDLERATGLRLSPRVLLLNSLQQVAAQLPARKPIEGSHPRMESPRYAPAEATSRPLVGRLLKKVRDKILGG